VERPFIIPGRCLGVISDLSQICRSKEVGFAARSGPVPPKRITGVGHSHGRVNGPFQTSGWPLALASSQQVTGQEDDIGRAFGEAPHKVGPPLIAVGHVGPHAVAFRD
jgi:hypothetical protein